MEYNVSSLLNFLFSFFIFWFRREIDNIDISIKISGSFISSKIWENYESCITIAFDQTVDITETFYPSISFSELFSDLGGSIGLWLGAGLLQICFYFVDFIYYIRRKLFKS